MCFQESTKTVQFKEIENFSSKKFKISKCSVQRNSKYLKNPHTNISSAKMKTSRNEENGFFYCSYQWRRYAFYSSNTCMKFFDSVTYFVPCIELRTQR